MAEKVKIDGDVGAAVNMENGSALTIHMVKDRPENRNPQEVIRKTAELLNQLDDTVDKAILECVSQAIFGTRLFKGLAVEQLQKLELIHNELQKKKSREKAEIKALSEQLIAAQSEIQALKARSKAPVSNGPVLKQEDGRLKSRIDELLSLHRDLEKRLSKKSDELKSAEQSLQQVQLMNAGLASQHVVAGAAASKVKRRLWIVALCAISTSAASAYLAAQYGEVSTSLRFTETQLEQCSFGGKRYPAGSIISLSDGDDLRCELPKDKAMASWVEVKPEKQKKNVTTKRKSKPKQAPAETDQAADIEVNGERLF